MSWTLYPVPLLAGYIDTCLLSIDRPHCSLSISGPATLSLSEPEYAFTVTLHYHSEPQSTSQPIVVRTSETALDVHTPTYDADAYVMYRSPDVNHEDRLQHYIVSICYRNIPGASSKFSITPGNGFIELAPGETVKTEVRLESRMFEKFLKPGEKRYLLYTGAGSRNVIRYWRYGTLEVRLALKHNRCIDLTRNGT